MPVSSVPPDFSTNREASPESLAALAAERRQRQVRLERLRRMYSRHLLEFVKVAWTILNPATELLINWHHKLIAEYLTLAFERKILRIVLNVPPRFTKSTLATIAWPCWVWAQRPTESWIFGSHNADLSTKHSIDRRTIMASEWYRARWPEVQFAVDQNLKMQYQNTARGEMIATSVGASVMGQSADTIVIDDPHDPERVLSEVERERALRWYDQQLSTRLNDPKTGVIVVIMQRLHQADLTGHVLELGGWTHISLPFEAKRDEDIVFPISGDVVHRQKGELLHPARFGPAEKAEKLKTLGSWGYAGQMQQDPVPEGGGIFKRDWWHFWGGPCARCGGQTVHGLPSAFDDVVQSWDMAFKDTEGADFVSGQAWARRGGDFFLLDRVNDRMNFPATIAAVEAFDASVRSRWREALTKLVEDKANGPAVVATLRHRIPGFIPVEPEGGKIARAQAVSPIAEAGNCYIPHPTLCPWVHEWLEQLSAFPRGGKDDDVDSASQALRRLAGFGLPGEAFMQYLGQTVAAQEQAKVTTRTVLRRGG